MFFKKNKKGYNKKVKNSALGSALRDSAGMAIGDEYDKGQKRIGENEYGKPISEYMKNKRAGNVNKLTKLSGVGLKLSGEGKMKDRRYRTPFEINMGNGMRLAALVVNFVGAGCRMINLFFRIKLYN